MNQSAEIAGRLPADIYRFRRPIAVGTLTTALVLIALLTGWYLSRVILLLFGGILFGIFLRGSVDLVDDYIPWGKRVAVPIVSVVLLLVLTGIGYAIGPALLSSFDDLTQQLPTAWNRFQEFLNQYPLLERATSYLQDAAGNMTSTMASKAMNMLNMIIAALTGGILILFVGFYLSIQPQLYAGGFLELIPPAKRPRAKEVLHKLDHSLRWWLVGRLASMAVVGLLTYGALLILGLPSALGLAVIAGLLSFIPNLGPVLSLLPAIAVAFTESFSMVVWVSGIYLAVQTVESYAITPLIQRKAVSLPPVYTLIFQIAMGLLFGVFGLLLATPTGVVVMVLVKMLYVQDTLRQPTELP